MKHRRKEFWIALTLSVFTFCAFLVDLWGCLHGDVNRYFGWYIIFLDVPAMLYFEHLCRARAKDQSLQKEVILLGIGAFGYCVGELILMHIYRA